MSHHTTSVFSFNYKRFQTFSRRCIRSLADKLMIDPKIIPDFYTCHLCLNFWPTVYERVLYKCKFVCWFHTTDIWSRCALSSIKPLFLWYTSVWLLGTLLIQKQKNSNGQISKLTFFKKVAWFAWTSLSYTLKLLFRLFQSLRPLKNNSLKIL